MTSNVQKGWIAWFAQNSVAANLLMICILIAGLMTMQSIRTEGFPGFEAKEITITIPYNSGSAIETERAVTKKVERALTGTEGIKKVTSTTTASMSTIRIEKTSGFNLDNLLADVKIKVDAVSLPDAAESPVVVRAREIEDAIKIELFGPLEQDVLSTIARRLKDRLLEDPLIPSVVIGGQKTQELTIKVNEQALQRYGLTFNDVVRQVQAFSLVSEQGSLKGENGRILVKADKQGYYKQDFEAVPILTLDDGRLVRLRELAQISDGYTDDESLFRFDGQSGRKLTVQMIGDANLIPTALKARSIVEESMADGSFPSTLQVKFWGDQSIMISDRLSLMMKNGLMGMGLVLLTLSLFLNLRTAFWVAMGLPIAFAGALFLMGDSVMGLTLNELTTFGFIIALGIVVDDAIVVAESVHTTVEAEGDGVDKVIKGVHKVATPAVFGVLTTMAAFYPITLVTGRLAEVFALFAWVVVFCLIFSIIESKFILPAHLAHIDHSKRHENILARFWHGVQDKVGNGLDHFRRMIYQPLVTLALKVRYLSALIFILMLVGVAYMIPAGLVRVVFFPEIPGSTISAVYESEPDLGFGRLFSEGYRIEAALSELNKELAKEEPSGNAPLTGIEMSASDNGTVTVTGVARLPADRSITILEIADRWRDKVGSVEGAKRLNFRSSDFDDADFSVELLLDDLDLLIEASQLVEQQISTQDGVLSITNNLRAVRGRMTISLTDYGRAIGLTTSSVSQQVFQAIRGAEIQRFQRDDQEVKVRVRYPDDLRNNKAALEQLYVRTPQGKPVLLSSVATLTPDFTVDEIYHRQRKRVATLEAQIDKGSISGTALTDYFNAEILPQLQAKYPGIEAKFAGEVEQQAEAIGGLATAFLITLIAIYVLLAVPLRSYAQPLIVMAAIPFGIVGAILGHWIVGLPISILSINGILALSGIVVNDSLLLVSAYNENKGNGTKIRKALILAGSLRMRAVILTSTTTFAGLAPMIFEKAEQAQFLIPAAVSLGFGILFATFITLFLIPVFLMILEDFVALIGKLIGAKPRKAKVVSVAAE